MADIFMFSSQSKQGTSAVVKEKPPDPKSSSKRARAVTDDDDSGLRSSSGDSFKSKLLGMSPPGSWSGFGGQHAKVEIGEGDVTVVVGPNGPAMKLSDSFKLQLCRPWTNALILKIMGRPHTLTFMLTKLRQKW